MEKEKNTKKPLKNPTTSAQPVTHDEVQEREQAEKKVATTKRINDDAMQTKKYAWLAYMLFFIPLLINSKSPFVRHHANEGLEINIFDFLGVVLVLVGSLVESTMWEWQLVLIITTVVGLILLTLTIVTKIYMIIATLKGKEVTTPWMWDVRIIK